MSSATLFAQQQQPQFHNPPPILQEPAPDGGGAGFTGTEGLTNVPPGAFQPDRVGLPQAALFRNTQYPFGQLTDPVPVGPSVRSDSVTADFKLTLPGLTGGLPFTQRGFEPQDADLKLGPFFFKLRALEAAFLFSDNINLTPNAQSGEIAITGVTIDIIAQLTQDLRITTSGTFLYLPLQGKFGIFGFGLNDFYQFGLAAGPLAHARIEWDTIIGGWNVVFMDDFQVLEGIYSNELRSDDALFDGGDFNDQAVAGRYVLRPEEGYFFQNHGPINNQISTRNDLLIYTNTVSAEADRLLPGTIRLQVLVYHEDLWYNQGNRGLPALREGATVSLISERENQRFKPYLVYEAFRTDELGGVQSIARLGIRGPITDQLHLLAEVGYYAGGNEGDGALWRLQLDDTLGPYTQQSLVYARNFNYFHDEIDEGVGYNLHQILGPKLNADLYAYRFDTDDYFSDAPQASQSELRLGLRFTCNAGPKTTIRLTTEYDTLEPYQTQAWLGRLEVGYNFTDTLLLHFLYQYQHSTSSEVSLNYAENLFFLSLTKYFR